MLQAETHKIARPAAPLAVVRVVQLGAPLVIRRTFIKAVIVNVPSCNDLDALGISIFKFRHTPNGLTSHYNWPICIEWIERLTGFSPDVIRNLPLADGSRIFHAVLDQVEGALQRQLAH